MSTVVGVVTSLLSLGDIPITMQLAPPAPSPPISVTVLNAMHYQRPETVIAVLAFLVGLGGLMAVLLACLSRPWRSASGSNSVMLMFMTLIIMVGCEQREEADPVLQVEAVIGGPGRLPGRFDYPRAAAIDQSTGDFYVIEKAGRVQRISSDGTPLMDWMMPRIDHGRPTGISIGPDGEVWIPDTHEHRILVYDDQGELQDEFGGYGTAPGQFIYPTDIAFGPDGLIYIAEYGGNDRIQVFNQQREWVRTLGSPGTAAGQFQRPQSIMFTPDGQELIVADARNRRVQSVNPMTGEARILVQGDVVGPLRVPFGLCVQEDGSILVTDVGSHQLLEYSAAGELQSSAGGWGWGAGQLRDPWVVMQRSGRTFVLDSGNSRILRLP
jgi:DNA-binding beta-propeller fold protein YncE